MAKSASVRAGRHRTAAVGTFLGIAVAAALSAPSAAAEPGRDFPTDERGFVDTAAHCQGSAVAVAYGRTEESLVTVCSGAGGQLQFRGVRLSDDAALMLAAQPVPGGYTAANDDVTYTVTPAELTVASGDATVIRQAMVEYHGAAH
jgi:hypothetical protein